MELAFNQTCQWASGFNPFGGFVQHVTILNLSKLSHTFFSNESVWTGSKDTKRPFCYTLGQNRTKIMITSLEQEMLQKKGSKWIVDGKQINITVLTIFQGTIVEFENVSFKVTSQLVRVKIIITFRSLPSTIRPSSFFFLTKTRSLLNHYHHVFKNTFIGFWLFKVIVSVLINCSNYGHTWRAWKCSDHIYSSA